MEDPEYIILVALDTPSQETGIYISGGVMAAPTVGAVMSDILPYLGVSRSREPEMVELPDLTGLTSKEAENALKELGLAVVFAGEGVVVSSQIPAPAQQAETGSQVIVYLKP